MMKEAKMLTNMKLAELVVEYGQSSKRLILLDYDGTLVNIQSTPHEVKPDKELLTIIERLANDEHNTVAIVTGRDQQYISQWFGNMNVYIFAEHGSFMKEPGTSDWLSLYKEDQRWKSALLPILETYTKANPGCMIEQKTSGLVWHYRNIDPQDSFTVSRALIHELQNIITPEMNISILEGKKVIEIKQKGYDKGSASQRIAQLQNFQFILAIGDDVTDEDMFNALPPYAYTFKVGYGLTRARMHIESPVEVVNLLKKLLQ